MHMHMSSVCYVVRVYNQRWHHYVCQCRSVDFFVVKFKVFAASYTGTKDTAAIDLNQLFCNPVVLCMQ